ncbi:TetR family transcriptional regulator [Actinoplanes philippinensis]|uniref:TetR/AcrR family transcriptional regulator, transcriptional repressor for nem operon n=1 Tax=Actinoplanes philippinensis TaxID=35752 RepID=A0A1I2GV27_9ACTN|nr:TetR family transcriptional regulator [Actinoplanes philippinensis]GIE78144.1 TetR family transcriptional regulator [Actinoplanes philippinensis]SFF21515.1 TetR/AcrR family transcriptional regulator, transcriptional repressor for nem operon [Actinoplanes philippinensis]
MGRVSQAQAAENRERIVTTAARLFRERGISGVSVADVTAEAGLTHGGFYKHFASKDALVAEAVIRAFAEQAAALGDTGSPAALIDAYLSAGHRDDPGAGCPSAGFGGDVARSGGGDATRRAYAEGVEGFARYLAGGDRHPADGDRHPTGGEDREQADRGADAGLATLSTMVGALILSRATAGTALSDRILTAARESLGLRDVNPVEAPAAGG